jgi:hypothetical protein
MTTITIYNQDRTRSYALTIPDDNAADEITGSTRIWLTNEEGQGGAFPGDEILEAVFEALDKYFARKY